MARSLSSTDQLVLIMLAVLRGKRGPQLRVHEGRNRERGRSSTRWRRFAGVREAVLWASPRPVAARLVLSLVLLVAASGWVVRTVGVQLQHAPDCVQRP